MVSVKRKKLPLVTTLILFIFLISSAFAAGELEFDKGFEEDRKGNSKEAIKYFTKALLLKRLNNEATTEVLFVRGVWYFSNGMHQNAINDFNEALESSFQETGRTPQDHLETILLRAMAYHALKKNVRALADLNLIFDKQPNIPLARFLRARIALDLDNPKMALEIMNELIPDETHGVSFLEFRAKVHKKLGDSQQFHRDKLEIEKLCQENQNNIYCKELKLAPR